MAFQINTGLTTSDGGTVDAGSYIIFNTNFPAIGLNYSVELFHYRSLAALNAGLAQIKTNEIQTNFYRKELTEQEFLNLTPMVIHEEVKTYLEQYVGVGNVQIIL